MPGYRTHDLAAYIATPIITVASSTIVPLPTAIAMGILFLASNHWLSPDLDIESIMIRRWGFLYFIWRPYKRLIYHRSIWSHSGPLSAAIRFLYLALWVLIPLLLIVPYYVIVTYVIQYSFIFISIYIAMALADSLHTILDKISGGF